MKIKGFKGILIFLLILFCLGFCLGFIIYLSQNAPETIYLSEYLTFTVAKNPYLYFIFLGLEFLLYGFAGLLAFWGIVWILKKGWGGKIGYTLLILLGLGMFYAAFLIQPHKNSGELGHKIFFSLMGVFFIGICILIKFYFKKHKQKSE